MKRNNWHRDEIINVLTYILSKVYDESGCNNEVIEGCIEGQWFAVWDSPDTGGLYVARYDSEEDMEYAIDADGGGVVEYYPNNKLVTEEMIKSQAEFALELIFTK